MKSSISTLNPFATSYVPIAKRDVLEVGTESNTSVGEVAATITSSAVDDLKLKGQQNDSAQGAPSEDKHDLDSKFMDEDSEMDLAYLQMMFPGVSDQSLVDVYNVNMGDLEAAVDMLTHLESADDHLDSLGDEDTQEPVSSGECSSVSSGECSSLKSLNVTGESTSAPAASSVTVVSS